MVKEIKHGFETMLKSIVDARVFRDDLARQAHFTTGSNWHGTIGANSNSETDKSKKTGNIPPENKRM